MMNLSIFLIYLVKIYLKSRKIIFKTLKYEEYLSKFRKNY